MTLRGKSRDASHGRACRLIHFRVHGPLSEGPQPCYRLILVRGKVNKSSGRFDYTATMRHKNPMLCTTSWRFIFFYRWEVAGEPVPEFHLRPNWCHLHVLRGDDNAFIELNDKTQLKWTDPVYKETNLTSIKKTHAGRANGARIADVAGVDNNQIRRAGNWNADSLSTNYLDNIRRQFSRAMAGLSPQVQGNYYLPGARTAPPETLRRSIWPWIADWLNGLTATTAGTWAHIFSLRPSATPPATGFEPLLTACAWIVMILQRKGIIQYERRTGTLQPSGVN